MEKFIEEIKKVGGPIPITIGSAENSNAVYYLVETNAPPDYDWFGTFTYQGSGDGDRFVMIREERLESQLMRYRSGLHKINPVRLDWVGNAIYEDLWNRLMGKVGADV